MALVKTEVSNLMVEKRTTNNTTFVRASWDYPKSTEGDLKYFKSFDIVWKYSYGETAGKKKSLVWYESTVSMSSHNVTGTFNFNDFTLPTVDITKVKTIDVYCTVIPTSNQKQYKVTDEDGKEKTKTKNPAWEGKLKKSGTIQIDTATVVEVSDPTITVEEIISGTHANHIKMSVTGYGSSQNAKSVEFQTRKDEKSTSGKTYKANLKNNAASRYTDSGIGKNSFYQVRVRGWSKENASGKHSHWSAWSDKIYGSPNRPKGEFKIQVAPQVDSAFQTQANGIPNFVIYDESQKTDDFVDAYILEYAPNEEDFQYNRSSVVSTEFSRNRLNQSSSTTSGGGVWEMARNGTCLHVRGYFDYPSNMGKQYYFRVRSKRGDKYSNWSNTISYSFGQVPAAPTAWIRKKSYKESEELILNWTHNSKDGSYMNTASIRVTINGYKCTNDIIYAGTESNDQGYEEATYMLNLGTIYDLIHSPANGQLFDNATITALEKDGQWMVTFEVKTNGFYIPEGGSVADSYSDYSAPQTCTVWAEPFIELSGEDVGGWLWDPFDFRYDTTETAYDGTVFQTPVTSFPMFVGVASGPEPQQAIYYTYTIVSRSEYDTIDYDGTQKHVAVGDILYQANKNPTAKYTGENNGNYCLNRINAWDILLSNNCNYTLNVSAVMNSGLTASMSMDFSTDFEDASFAPDAETIPDNVNYSMTIIPQLADDMEYAEGEDELELSDVVFHVFRRNYDDTMTNIATGITGDTLTGVIDPHPIMKGGLYRIVAMSKKTGEVQFVDIPSQSFDEVGILIQWDEVYQEYDIWEDYDDENDTLLFGSGMNSSMLFLPYNINTQNQYSMDVELVDYLGREHPVSYYGTQKGESLTLSTEIPKEGTEDIVLAMRRLSNYRGDCYIREPSGTGFWARVEISFNINHLAVTIPISITATRVEGGI